MLYNFAIVHYIGNSNHYQKKAQSNGVEKLTEKKIQSINNLQIQYELFLYQFLINFFYKNLILIFMNKIFYLLYAFSYHFMKNLMTIICLAHLNLPLFF